MFVEYHEKLLACLEDNLDSINTGVSILTKSILHVGEQGGSVWLIGNGGSASTVEHFETDLSFVRLTKLLSLPRVCSLTSNTALVTATANDCSFDSLFETILSRRASTRDLLIAFSVSGNSTNILNALTYANKMSISTISLLGFDGGRASSLSEVSIVIKSQKGEYGLVEDIHLSICHAVTEKIRGSINDSKTR